ncbi:MAG: glucose-6-phosphate isomerase [Treponema sp. RIFOXYC1_FULL_61_9]|nr:MAG: glucose-6-phosphate isomerase [Treponema sp. RIFOXYC1_FULL_61_9]
MIAYSNLDSSSAYSKLLSLAPKGKPFDFSVILDAARVRQAQIPIGAGLTYSWAAKAVDERILNELQALADEQELIGKYTQLLDGEFMNTGESRRVLHQLLRGRCGKAVVHEGRGLGAFYEHELERLGVFADKVHSGALRGTGGDAFTTVVQIGIGGSDLGPRALYLALENWADANGKRKMAGQFISNVDPDDAAQVMARIDPARTLFVLVSKSGVTQETLANELFVKARLLKAGLDPTKHMVAVTSETSPLARNPAYLDSFYIDDFIGGRYSSTSAVGGVILSLAFGKETFSEILRGAHEADLGALQKDIRKNAALLDALIGIWERNFLGYPTTAVLPYSQSLNRFPAHLQQLDMESNGKRVNRAGKTVAYATGPVVFGESGTNGQHSFYQLLHQGSDIVPLQFVGFQDSLRGEDVEVDGSSSQTKLKANLVAQIIAFAKGKKDANGNKEFPGGRPSSLIFGKSLTPAALGALLAHFENKVMFQGFAWNLNSFDQEGVQLGKLLTKQVLSGTSGDSAIEAYAALLKA